jgi:hypothetical protein
MRRRTIFGSASILLACFRPVRIAPVGKPALPGLTATFNRTPDLAATVDLALKTDIHMATFPA